MLPTFRGEPYEDPDGHAGPGWYVFCMSGCLGWPDGPYATREDAIANAKGEPVPQP